MVEEEVKASLEEHDVPGAAVAVVRDGEITLTAGYGLADRETGRKAEETTPFRIGSLAKPVVATAIARLLQRDELDPRRPVSEYLEDDLRSWDDPVTLADLVTHTAGFETTNLGMWYDDPAEVPPLPDLLDRYVPAQVRPPGERGAYSNHGFALAGQVLASVVGEPFPRAIEEVLLDPAGMGRSSFRQPLPDELHEPHALGHDEDGIEGKFAGLGMTPAGALSTTATDMARFMQLHLNDGMVEGERVLESETVGTIQRQWFTHHDELAGMAFGFLEGYHGDTRILHHSGGTLAFQSELFLVPEREFGFFVAYNSERGGDAREAVAEAVREALLGDPAPDGLTPDGRPSRAAELPGTYRTLRLPETTHDALLMTATATTVDVSVDDDGALLVNLAGEKGRWIEVAPLVFRHAETGRKLAFGESGGEVTYLYVGGAASAFATVEWHESIRTHGVVGGIAVAGLLWGWHAWKPDREEGESRREWLASLRSDRERLAGVLAYAGSVAFLTFLAISLLYFFSAPFEFLSDPSPLYRTAFALPVLGAALALVALLTCVIARMRGYWNLRRRVYYGLATGALVVTTGFLWYWNLLLPP